MSLRLIIFLPLALWAQQGSMTVSDDAQALVHDPAGDLVRLRGALLSMERPGQLSIEVRFEEVAQEIGNELPVSRMTVYKWHPPGPEVDCTKTVCWTELQQISNYKSARASWVAAVRTGDRFLLSFFNPAETMRRAGRPTELIRQRQPDRRYWAFQDDDENEKSVILLTASNASVRLRIRNPSSNPAK